MEVKRLSSKSLTELHTWYYSEETIAKLRHNVQNAKKLSWAHIDLNSSYPTKKTLMFIYPLVEKNGIILFDDYGFDGYQDTRKVIDDFIFRKISIP